MTPAAGSGGRTVWIQYRRDIKGVITYERGEGTSRLSDGRTEGDLITIGNVGGAVGVGCPAGKGAARPGSLVVSVAATLWALLQLGETIGYT
jgi:hypothetical protein